jgi:predicted Rossmann-fold nucleotide-binding protein
MTTKIITGGQSGVDRAALDIAIRQSMPYGGWCPRGGWAEDMPEPPGLLGAYPALRETPSKEPAERTEWNIRDSDAVLILVGGGGIAVSEGTAYAEKLAEQHEKPLMVVNMDDAAAIERAGEWLTELQTAHRVEDEFKLAIGGPRESQAPGIYEQASRVLDTLLDNL